MTSLLCLDDRGITFFERLPVFCYFDIVSTTVLFAYSGDGFFAVDDD